MTSTPVIKPNSKPGHTKKRSSWASFDAIDRRWIYLLVFVSLAVPTWFRWQLPPAQMKTSDAFYQAIEQLPAQSNKLALVAADWGPSTQAENKPQTEVAIEHLMRRRIPFALVSLIPYAQPFLENVPKEIAAKLKKELPGEEWHYGKDWVNFGYQPNALASIQGIAKAGLLSEFWKTDVAGTPYSDIPCLKEVKTIKDILMLIEITGSIGTFNFWIQFFRSDDYRPPFVHGCTSITIPEAHIYLASKQLVGLLEGAAGAAWYEKLLTDHYPGRELGTAIRTNTTLAVAHLLIILLIVIGNIATFVRGAST